MNATSTPDSVERFEAPWTREARVAALCAAGYSRSNPDGRPLPGKSFRLFERLGGWYLRICEEAAPTPSTEKQEPTRCPAGCVSTPIKFGKDRWGVQRWRCRACLRTWRIDPRPQGGNRLPKHKEEALRAALLAGHSLRTAAKLAGVAKMTASRYAAGRSASCPCGQPAGHRGWCSWRYAHSPARQAWIAAWKERRRLQLADTGPTEDGNAMPNNAALERLRRELVAARPSYLDPEILDLLSPVVLRRTSERALGGRYLLRPRCPEKTRLRQRVVDAMAALPGRIHVLTMPAVQWIAERDFLAAREAPSVLEEGLVPAFTRIHAVEWSRVVFLSALQFMPGMESGLSYRSAGGWDLSSRTVSQYVRTRFEDYVAPVDGFAAAWIDLTGPLTNARIARIAHLWRYPRMQFLAVTYMRARHQIQKPLEKLLWSMAGHEPECFPYQSGAIPMMQIHLSRSSVRDGDCLENHKTAACLPSQTGEFPGAQA